MHDPLTDFWTNDDGQSVAEYALLLAVLLVVVAGVSASLGANCKTMLSKAADALGHKSHH